MAFDNPTRNRLARLVSDCRRLLTDEFSIQLQQHYGIQPDGQIIALEQLGHLDDEQRAVAALLRERIDHIISGLVGEKRPAEVAVDRLLREQAFTLLNRFAALRMCEERELVPECVRQGLQSSGFKTFLQVAGSGLGDTWQRYRTYLHALFDEISVDLGVLFDRFSPSGLLFPREAALGELFNLLNTPDLRAIWAEDETIGWIYQYFNSKEERQAMRKASAAPRNSRELAVRNQFFTPRYVVEFLTDNTLGRTWYEMRQGQTRLTEQCRYLVRRPHEVFLPPGEEVPEPPPGQEELNQEELLRQPHHIPFRPKKDPRDLRILDPACGSGHFLLYAFDLLQTIYEEAWEDEAMPPAAVTGAPLHRDYSDREALLLAIPELILRHNLHGIDIDPRAVQIAALALWLRSQRGWKEQRVKPADRPRIRKSHIVCAEPMPGEREMLKEFTAALEPPLLGQIVEKIFDRMQLAGEAGSLLKIEEEIQESIAKAKEQWQRMYERATDKLGNKMLFTRHEMDDLREDPQLMLGLFDVSKISDSEFWDTVEERILAALRDYAEHSSGSSLSRRMFAEDAAKGFAFIDLCRKRYDVVLMNPPFGVSSVNAINYLTMHFKTWNNNLLCAFIERSSDLLFVGARIGAIHDRTSLIKSTYKSFRINILLEKLRIELISDLGWEVLDAQVEVTTSIFTNTHCHSTSLFIDARKVDNLEKAEKLLSSISSIANCICNDLIFIKKVDIFNFLPNAVIGYDFPNYIIKAFTEFESFEKKGYKCFQGHALKAEKHFRLWYEVSLIQKRDIIHQLYNGSHFVEYCSPLRDVVIAPCELTSLPTDSSTVLRNNEIQFLPGIGYGVRGDYFDAHILPPGRIFTVEGQCMPIEAHEDIFCILGLLNSTLFRFGLNLYSGQHKYSGYINLFPFKLPEDKKRLVDLVSALVEDKLEFSAYDETQTYYRKPLFSLLNESNLSMELMIHELSNKIDNSINKEKNAKHEIDEILINVFGLADNQKTKLVQYKKHIPNAAFIFEDLPLEPNQLIMFVIQDLISYIFGAVMGRWDIRFHFKANLYTMDNTVLTKSPVYPINMLYDDAYSSLTKSSSSQIDFYLAGSDANSLPPEGSVKNPTIKDEEYPIRISWQGILVDDAFAAEGQTHQEDILRRTREVIEVLWKERAPAIEQEACEILGIKSLRDYFRKPGGFFQDHLKRYSKSRRQAPIYWPLSSENGNYTLWIYYHRLTDQFLYTCVNDYVNPRIDEVTRDIEQLRKRQISDSSRVADSLKQAESLQDFLIELKSFRDELLQVARLPYKPDLNDGVIITAAPLWKLFRLPKWRKDLKACWEKLQAGDYDWAHLAYAIWPDRVRDKCVTDKSLAIAHDLEHLYDESRAPKRKRAKPVEAESEEDIMDDEN